jgi:hypothetical protein
MTIWKITRKIVDEPRSHAITDVQPLSEGQCQIEHAGSMVPIEILPGEVIRLSPRSIKSEGMSLASFDLNEWVQPGIVSVSLQLREKQRLFWIWGPKENGQQVYVSVEKHEKAPRVGKERL